MEAIRTGALSPVGSQVNSLLSPLKGILEGMAEQYEAMKEVVAALQDSERGKHASLASLLAQHQERNSAEVATTKSEVRCVSHRGCAQWLGFSRPSAHGCQFEAPVFTMLGCNIWIGTVSRRDDEL